MTKFNEQGFPTVVTVAPGATDAPKAFDSKGFPITDGATATVAPAKNIQTSAPAAANGGATGPLAGRALWGAGAACGVLGGMWLL